GTCGLQKQCIWLDVMHIIHLKKGRFEHCQGVLDQQGARDKRMSPSGRACKLWDGSARQWHGKKLGRFKVGLWALSWHGKGKTGKYSKCWKLWVLKAGHVRWLGR
ncbi:hypothetical protein HAX54_038528, partial [Datura stramonium]|nr:hypothetical protein [Datura stramonium]